MLDYNACVNATDSFSTIKMRWFNYGNQCDQAGGADCIHQWNDTESNNSYAVVGTSYRVMNIDTEIDGRSATLPWRADNIPFPNNPNVCLLYTSRCV